MEIEPISAQMMAKKLWNMVKVMFYMLKQGLTKSKLLLDLHMMLKRGKLAIKAFTNLMLHHHYANIIRRSNTINTSFVSSQEYYDNFNRTKSYNDAAIMKQVFDMLNNGDVVVEDSPEALPGFGRTPVVRQLRVTDSPFPMKEKEEEEDDTQVDMAAEEFINKFYEQLKRQKRIGYIESPSPYHI